MTDAQVIAKMIESETARRHGLLNDLGDKAAQCPGLVYVWRNVVEPIQTHYPGTIVTSGYRSQQVNRAVGSQAGNKSQHLYPCTMLKGKKVWAAGAVDLRIGGRVNSLVLAREILAFLKSRGMLPDQVISEYGPNGPIHVGIKNPATGEKARGMVFKLGW